MSENTNTKSKRRTRSSSLGGSNWLFTVVRIDIPDPFIELLSRSTFVMFACVIAIVESALHFPTHKTAIVPLEMKRLVFIFLSVDIAAGISLRFIFKNGFVSFIVVA